MYSIIKCACDCAFFAAFIACIYCTFRWIWICFRHKDDLKGRKHYSAAAFILGVVSALSMTASFAAAVLEMQSGG